MDSPKPVMTWTRPLSIWLAPALMLALGVAVILFDGLGIADTAGNALFDAFQRHTARPFVDGPLAVRALELPSFDEDTLVKVTRTLAAQGAKMIVLTAPLESTASPQSMAARLPPGSDAARAELTRLPEPGHDLAAEIVQTKAVMPVVLGVAGREPHIMARFVYRGTANPFGHLPQFGAASGTQALLETNAAGSAGVNLIPDSDGILRRVPMVFQLGNALVPGMAAEVLRVAMAAPDITVTSNERNPLTFLGGTGIASLETPSGPAPTDGSGRIRLHYAANISERMLNPNALTAVPVKDAVVVIGKEGQTIRTPLGTASVAGIISESIENLAANSVLVRPSWARLLEAFVLAALGLGVIFLLRFGLGWPAALVMAGVALMGLASWQLYASRHLLIDAATPALFLVLAFGAGAAAWIQDMRLAYAGLRIAFSDSLPRATIEKIARRPSLLKLDGETRTITYLVCGVRGLAGMAATYKDDAAGFTALMQKALSPLIDQALAHGGTIDRLTADGFAAFWNAPLDDADHALHACEAANGMAIMSARVTEELAQQGAGMLVEIGVGVATGPVIAGGYGGYGRMVYSVNGDAVNLAQRLQGLSHQYGPALIVADETRRLAERGFAFLEVDTIAAGISDPPVTLYAIMGNPVARASPKLRALTVFHDHIFQAIRKQHWKMARDLIAQCRRLSGASQKMYDLHLARIAYYEKHPPGENWDGAFRPILE
ncbi:MAG: adenylate/guanylate cyclase domain-containing protein [Alphaproteobacteria bacterium]|nr:adenylate/guanylate cyclase domain-containing protein [Alphaproteobacteria bacterium]